MRRLPKDYRIGNQVYFIYADLPHTGVIKYVQTDSFYIEDMTFVHEFDKREVVIPKYSCTKTGEIYLPVYPDRYISDFIKKFDKSRYYYEAMPKRRIMGGTDLSPLIEFKTDDMFFFMDDNNWYRYALLTDDKKEIPVLWGFDKILIPKWLYQKHFYFDSRIDESKNEIVTEKNIVAIAQKDKAYESILQDELNRRLYGQAPIENFEKILGNHLDIIYRRDMDPVMGYDFGHNVPFKHIPGVIQDARIN